MSGTYTDSDGTECEATFDHRSEATDFVERRKPPRSKQANDTPHDGARNRAMLNRIAGRGGPKNLPRTLQVVLNRLAGTMQTREG